MLLMALALIAADTTQTIRVPVAPAESIVVTIEGEGEPVVLVPGLFGSGFSYRRVMEILAADGYRAIAIEPLGTGSSSRPEEADYSLTAQSDRVAAVMDSIGVPHAVVVGHSQGSSIAMRLAIRHPGKVDAIVSIEGGPSEALLGPGMRRAMRFAPMLRMVNAQGMVMRKILHDMKEVSEDPDWVTRAVVVGYTRGLAEEFGATMMAYRTMADTDEPEALAPLLPQLDCPVILLVSDMQHGVGIPADELSLMLSSVSDFTVDTVTNTGFFIQEEQPGAIAEAVRLLFADSAVSTH